MMDLRSQKGLSIVGVMVALVIFSISVMAVLSSNKTQKYLRKNAEASHSFKAIAATLQTKIGLDVRQMILDLIVLGENPDEAETNAAKERLIDFLNSEKTSGEFLKYKFSINPPYPAPMPNSHRNNLKKCSQEAFPILASSGVDNLYKVADEEQKNLSFCLSMRIEKQAFEDENGLDNYDKRDNRSKTSIIFSKNLFTYISIEARNAYTNDIVPIKDFTKAGVYADVTWQLHWSIPNARLSPKTGKPTTAFFSKISNFYLTAD